MNLYSQFTKRNLAFDIGANIGSKTQSLLESGFKKIICLEPQPDCVEVLKNKFKNNNKVVVDERAVSFKSGSLSMSVCSNANVISTLSEFWKTKGRFAQRNYNWDKVIEVNTTSLDNLINQYGLPDFCKIDVEGYEWEVISGLTNAIPVISFEFSIEIIEIANKCLQHLKQINPNIHMNYIVGNRDYFAMDKFTNDIDQILGQIILDDPNYQNEWGVWGDIYVFEDVV